MLEPTEKETKWFVKRLIELRDTVDLYHSPIDLELKDVQKWEEESDLKLSKYELKDRIFYMLKEIKEHYIENNNNPLFAEGLQYNEYIEGKIKIEGYTTKMLVEYKIWLSLSREARLALSIKPIEKIPVIRFKTNGKSFEFNINNGSFKLGKIKGRFRIKTQEFRILKYLVENRNSIVSYEIICSCLGLITASPQRETILSILKRTKNKMGILPKGKTANPDIFTNDTNFGYGIFEY